MECLDKIKLEFENSSVDVRKRVKEELPKLRSLITPGSKIAIAAGSRGINSLPDVVFETVAFVKDCQAHPFIIPAMGSHGGATAEGQAEVLEGYGISEMTMKAPVLSSMDVIELKKGDSPVSVYMDKNAWQADGIILVNRIKPHTDFHGRYESGLVKMSVIGLGKEKQASAVHSYGVYGLSELIPVIARQILKSGKIIGGIALIENRNDEISHVEALKSDEILEKEPVLLEMARNSMPSLPVKNIDVLIIDEMGKDISGVGIDTNIIGRMKIKGQDEPAYPDIKSIAVLDLTVNSHGNAIGMGLADVITRRLYDKIDFTSTYTNSITSSFLERAKVPVIAGSDREAFEIALRSCGHIINGEERVIRIKNTLHLNEMYVSKAISTELKKKKCISISEEEIRMFRGDDFIPF
jgi:hypothetical protein